MYYLDLFLNLSEVNLFIRNLGAIPHLKSVVRSEDAKVPAQC